MILCNKVTLQQKMRDSNAFMYIIAGIIVLHFLVGFVWLIYKFSKKKEK